VLKVVALVDRANAQEPGLEGGRSRGRAAEATIGAVSRGWRSGRGRSVRPFTPAAHAGLVEDRLEVVLHCVGERAITGATSWGVTGWMITAVRPSVSALSRVP